MSSSLNKDIIIIIINTYLLYSCFIYIIVQAVFLYQNKESRVVGIVVMGPLLSGDRSKYTDFQK